MKPTYPYSLKGMSLIELLVVLAILGILLLLAFPVLSPLITKTHTLEAKTNLKHLANLQAISHMESYRYSPELSAIGFEQATLVGENDGTAHYRIEIVQANQENFLARAVSVTDFDGDGTFNVWEIDRGGIPKETVPD